MRTPSTGPSGTQSPAVCGQEEKPEGFLEALHASGALLGILVYLLAVAFLTFAIVGMTGGHFVYTLDDPYIHLALAERVRSGLYGINAGEFASPSSSILWPLLFVPFVRSSVVTWLPLCLNTFLGACTIQRIALCVRRSFGQRNAETDGRTRLLVLLLVFALNLPGLTLTGMEHVFQLLLSVCCAEAMVRVLHAERTPWWTLTAAALLPSVRYEGALLTFAVAAVLWCVNRKRTAMLVVGSSAVVPVCFSIFLRHLGLPAFPLSVLLKSAASFRSGGAGLSRVIATLLHNAIDTLRDTERTPQLILCFVLGYLAYRNRRRRTALIVTATACFVALMQMAVGPNGWFYRYEIYALAFTLLVAIAAEAWTGNTLRDGAAVPLRAHFRPSGGLLVAVGALAAVYMQPLLATPAAALGIYEQQFQLARLTRDFYTGPVAVNDLGLVSFYRTPQQYVFDLYGLGSYESARMKPQQKTPAWLDAITREHGIGMVAIYPDWFERGVPANWRAVGKLCSPHAPVSAYSSRVMIYATSAVELPNVELALQRFDRTLPKQATLELNPPNSYNTCKEE